MAGLRSSTVRAGLPITRRTEPSSIRSASCRLLRKSAPQHSLWTAWTSLARPTPPTGQQQHPKRTFDVLQKPDIFTRSRQPRPAVVIQSEPLAATDSLLVCPLTSTQRDAPLYRLSVAPDAENGLRRASDIMVDKITAVQRARIGAAIGT